MEKKSYLIPDLELINVGPAESVLVAGSLVGESNDPGAVFDLTITDQFIF